MRHVLFLWSATSSRDRARAGRFQGLARVARADGWRVEAAPDHADAGHRTADGPLASATNSLSLARTVSISWLSTYSVDSPSMCAYAYKVSLILLIQACAVLDESLPTRAGFDDGHTHSFQDEMRAARGQRIRAGRGPTGDRAEAPIARLSWHRSAGPIVWTDRTRSRGVSDPPGRGRDGQGRPPGGSLTPRLHNHTPRFGRHKTPPAVWRARVRGSAVTPCNRTQYRPWRTSRAPRVRDEHGPASRRDATGGRARPGGLSPPLSAAEPDQAVPTKGERCRY